MESVLKKSKGNDIGFSVQVPCNDPEECVLCEDFVLFQGAFPLEMDFPEMRFKERGIEHC